MLRTLCAAWSLSLVDWRDLVWVAILSLTSWLFWYVRSWYLEKRIDILNEKVDANERRTSKRFGIIMRWLPGRPPERTPGEPGVAPKRMRRAQPRDDTPNLRPPDPDDTDEISGPTQVAESPLPSGAGRDIIEKGPGVTDDLTTPVKTGREGITIDVAPTDDD